MHTYTYTYIIYIYYLIRDAVFIFDDPFNKKERSTRISLCLTVVPYQTFVFVYTKNIVLYRIYLLQIPAIHVVYGKTTNMFSTHLYRVVGYVSAVTFRSVSDLNIETNKYTECFEKLYLARSAVDYFIVPIWSEIGT